MNTPPRFLLRIPAPIYDAMLVHVRTDLPAECCGLLAGRISADGLIAEVVERYPLINELNSPTEFLSEPRSMFAAVRGMRSKGIEVLAVYHSHPTSEPIPSKRDLERNYSGSIINLIIGLVSGLPDVRGWWLTESAYHVAGIEVVSNPKSEFQNPK